MEVFRDAYMVEFLGLPRDHAEADLHGALIDRLKEFLSELGRDFCFVGSQYPLQVGGRDFALDLLFFHRGLNCLVAIELKVSVASNLSTWASSIFIWRRWIAMSVSLMKTLPSACCYAPVGTTRWLNTHLIAVCLQR